MRRLKTLCAVAALVSLCGCQSLTVMALKSFDQKPYSLPVAAETARRLAAQPVEASRRRNPHPLNPTADASPRREIQTADLTSSPKPP